MTSAIRVPATRVGPPKRLRVGVVDLVGNNQGNSLWNRFMHPNFASMMPQAMAVWCEQAGHDVTFACYTAARGPREAPALRHRRVVHSGLHQRRRGRVGHQQPVSAAGGTVTVLGGPHARCYPEDAARYFDYVLGFTDRALVEEVLARLCAAPAAGPASRRRSGSRAQLPGVKERWKFIAPTIAKAPTIKLVPMIGSLGCPYTCSFCIDATVDYQPLGHDQIQEDLRFLLDKLKRPRVGWHDPNFGVRFDETMAAIEEAVPPGRIDFAAESSLSLLSEPHLKRLAEERLQGHPARHRVVVLPWATSRRPASNVGMEKVRQVSDHVNMILRYIPYVQTNFVLGLDDDEGDEPFELTKRFVDLTPGRLPRLLAAVRVRPGGAPEPRPAARGPRAARSRSTSSTTTTP